MRQLVNQYLPVGFPISAPLGRIIFNTSPLGGLVAPHDVRVDLEELELLGVRPGYSTQVKGIFHSDPWVFIPSRSGWGVGAVRKLSQVTGGAAILLEGTRFTGSLSVRYSPDEVEYRLPSGTVGSRYFVLGVKKWDLTFARLDGEQGGESFVLFTQVDPSSQIVLRNRTSEGSLTINVTIAPIPHGVLVAQEIGVTPTFINPLYYSAATVQEDGLAAYVPLGKDVLTSHTLIPLSDSLFNKEDAAHVELQASAVAPFIHSVIT